MDRDESWSVIAQQRRAIADLLEDVGQDAWDTPSLCTGWRVRDVAAHVELAAHPPPLPTILWAAIQAGGRFHRLNHHIAVRHADGQGTRLANELRTHADSRRLPPVTNLGNALFDVLVHAQDIAVPLGRTIAMPVDAAAAGATRVWTMGWPFHAQRRLRGVRLVATDAAWAVGTGPEVRGPIEALLLLLTGRTAALPRLAGDGLPALTEPARHPSPPRRNRAARPARRAG